MGKTAGLIFSLFLKISGGKKSPLEQALNFTEILEGSMGVLGINELIDTKSAKRTIRHCPLSGKLNGLSPLR